MRVVILSAVVFVASCSSDRSACDAFRGGYPINNKVLNGFSVDGGVNADDENVISNIKDCVAESPYLGNGRDISLNKKYKDDRGNLAYSFFLKNVTDIEIVVTVGNNGRTMGVFQKSTH